MKSENVKKMGKIIASTLSFVLLTIGSIDFSLAQEPNYFSNGDTSGCSQFFPKDMQGKFVGYAVICRLNYAVVYDEKCKIPYMTFERLRPEDLDGVTDRTDDWRIDPSVPKQYQSKNSDYRKSGFDKGHMVPAADMKENTASMSQTFYLSNATPQYPNVNRNVWKKIEKIVRKFIIRNGGDYYVITTAEVHDNPDHIGNGVCVPRYYKKVVRRVDDGVVFGYYVPNKKHLEFQRPKDYHIHE